MVSLVMLALGLGADSFRVSAVLSALDSTRRHRIVLTFGVCDGLATAAGLASGWWLESILHRRAAIVGSIVVGLYGLFSHPEHASSRRTSIGVSGIKRQFRSRSVSTTLAQAWRSERLGIRYSHGPCCSASRVLRCRSRACASGTSSCGTCP